MKLDTNDKYLDRWLASNLDIFKNNNEKRDLDTVILIAGHEGSGKSTLGSQIGYYFDRKLSVDQVTFNLQEFTEALLTAKPGSVVILDEGDEISGSNWSNNEVKLVVSVLKRVRKKNLYIIICTPDFFKMLDYLIIRCNCLLYCKFGHKNERLFDFFSKKRASAIYQSRRGKRWFAAKRNFWAAFTSWMPFSKEEYEDKKDKSIMNTRSLTYTRKNVKEDTRAEVQLIPRGNDV